MCTAKLKFQNIVARWPGSTHDSLIFLNSAAKYTFDSGTFGSGLILGDSGYFLNNYLVTPYANTRTTAERLYNESHIRTRNVIERCFGVWKRRFPVLSIGMRCQIPLVQDIIVATAVIHNITIDMNEDKPPEDPEVSVHLEEELETVDPLIEDSGDARNLLLEYFESLIAL